MLLHENMELLHKRGHGDLNSVASATLPEIPQLSVSNLGNLTKSSPEFRKLNSYIIDNPQDEELQRREKLWNFQQRNRGAIAKNNAIGDPESTKIPDIKPAGDKENVKEKTNSKIRTKRPFESRGSGGFTGANECAPAIQSNNKESNLTYSSDLQIGNTLYNQIRGQDKENLESTSAGSDEARRSIVQSIDKLPNLSTSLTKLGYLKMTKNVVHYGGGFFGRHADKRYTDLRRSWPAAPPSDFTRKIQKPMETSLDEKQKSIYHPSDKSKGQSSKGSVKSFEFWEALSLNARSVKQHPPGTTEREVTEQPQKDSPTRVHIRTGDVGVLQKTSQRTNFTKCAVVTDPVNIFEIHGIKQQDKTEGEDGNGKQIYNLKKYPRLLPPAPVVSRQFLKDKGSKRTSKEELPFTEKSNKVERQKRLQKQAKHKVPDWLQIQDKASRPSSDISLDIPSDKFGHTSQRKEEKVPPSFGIRPYRWNNKPNLSVDDRGWVEREIGKNTVIDNSTYDTFARTKPASLSKISKEQTSFTDGTKSNL